MAKKHPALIKQAVNMSKAYGPGATQRHPNAPKKKGR